ncbi:MAG: fold metallo-hydrolase, partial [Conexibacter sp.]|nr:fold metallo-hydrolase [Conexibacter sp.]
PFASVLVAGDYVSPVELPMISEGGSRDAYVATLLRLAPYVERADWVVPGHGAAIDGQRALAILREDIKYLESLGRDGVEPALPLTRRDRVQKRIHAENVGRV